jgi:hypothetical protein
MVSTLTHYLQFIQIQLAQHIIVKEIHNTLLFSRMNGTRRSEGPDLTSIILRNSEHPTGHLFFLPQPPCR